MINWNAIRRLLKADEEYDKAYEELENDRFVHQIEAKILNGDYKIGNGLLYVRMGDMTVHELVQRKGVLREAGFEQVDANFHSNWLMRDYTEWEFAPKES